MRKIICILMVFLVLGLVGCTQKISEVKSPDYVGKTVTVSGTVKNSIKIGPLSGFTLVEDDDNSISVSSETLPAEGKKVTVQGVLIKDTIFGYYIKAEKTR